jgi:hypothetical protein
MESTINALIEGCKGIPRKWSRRFPSHKADFHSEAKLAVVEAINKYGEKATLPLVRTIVGRKCLRLISYIPVVRIPDSTGIDLKAKGQDTMCSTISFECCVERHAPQVVDIDDTINCICISDREKFIVDRLLEGETQQQIADTLGITRQRVQQLIVCIRKQFNDTQSIR